jgi:serine protease Do
VKVPGSFFRSAAKFSTACALAFSVGAGVKLAADSAVSTLPKLKGSDPLPANLFVELAKKVNPAVVNIYTTYLPKGLPGNPYGGGGGDPMMEMFEQFMFPGMPPRQGRPQQALGSGFVIREDGLIVTNNHVVDRADVIKVQIEEGRNGQGYDAKIVGKDAKTDIALIKIDAKKKLPYLKMGDSSEAQVGEWVAAFGNPYGYGHSMTKGIISALGRELDDLNLFPFIQTDASINSGNSGGPLVNTQGLVIGVNTAIDQRAQGIGFAIPIDNVKTILPQLEKDGTIKRGMLGVILDDISDEGANALDMKQSSGAMIVQVIPESGAEKAGLQPYDLIVEVDSKKVASSVDLTKHVASAAVGQKVNLKVIRDGRPRQVAVVVTSAEAMKAAARKAPPVKRGGPGGILPAPFGLGFAVADYSPVVQREFNLPQLRQPRPVIVQVEYNKEAARSGLAPGDIILDVNRSEVSRAKDVTGKLKKGTINILRVLKQDRVVLVSLRAT